jgi:lipopolysaccharide export system protein LptA
MTRALTLAAVAALALGVSAQAQISPSGKGPIDITADSGVFSSQTCESTWSGAAEALQGDSRLRANVIKAYLKHKPVSAKPEAQNQGQTLDPQGNCGATDRMEADGDVFFVTPTQIAKGDHAVYTAADDTIVMTGNVIVVQGKDVARGDRMTIHVATREVHLESNATGRGTPHRVQGFFYPSQAAGQPGAPAPAAP